MLNNFRFTAMAILSSLFFSSCSDDDKKVRSIELEYRIAVETLANPILSVTYVDQYGEQVVVTGNDESVTVTTDMTIFSKTITVRPPFEAQMTAMMQNNSEVAIPYLISIAEDGVIAISQNSALPANSPHENSISYAFQVTQ